MAKTILIVGYVWPEPKSSAAGSHMLSLLKLFKKQGWRVVFSTPAQTTEHMYDLKVDDIEIEKIALNDSSFDKFVLSLQPDYVMFDRFMMEEQFGWRVEKNCPNTLRILDTEDLQSLRFARQLALKEGRELENKDWVSEIAKREVAAIYRSDLSLIISDFEMSHLQKHYGVDKSLLFHLPFMLDEKQLLPKGASFEDRAHFVTIGNFRHAPNWDSVLYLQQIWPLIRRQLPDAQLHIYGSYPAKKATQLNNPKTGFFVKGRAEDAHDVLSKARVCLAPLRFGAGIKGKLIDAMQTQTPSVTTSIGAEGMHGEMPWPGIIADDPESIAQAAINLYTDKSLWQSKLTKIEALLHSRYNGEKLGAELIKYIALLESRLSQHREENTIGAILNHHSLKSTMFMSKWIEEKQKNQQS